MFEKRRNVSGFEIHPFQANQIEVHETIQFISIFHEVLSITSHTFANVYADRVCFIRYEVSQISAVVSSSQPLCYDTLQY